MDISCIWWDDIQEVKSQRSNIAHLWMDIGRFWEMHVHAVKMILY